MRKTSIAANGKTLVIQGGTLIDGSGGKPKKNNCLVGEGDRIKSIGAKPKGLNLRGRNVEVIDALLAGGADPNAKTKVYLVFP